jgi:hypothetical protein
VFAELGRMSASGDDARRWLLISNVMPVGSGGHVGGKPSIGSIFSALFAR